VERRSIHVSQCQVSSVNFGAKQVLFVRCSFIVYCTSMSSRGICIRQRHTILLAMLPSKQSKARQSRQKTYIGVVKRVSGGYRIAGYRKAKGKEEEETPDKRQTPHHTKTQDPFPVQPSNSWKTPHPNTSTPKRTPHPQKRRKQTPKPTPKRGSTP
jgi:hypothetical protein